MGQTGTNMHKLVGEGKGTCTEGKDPSKGHIICLVQGQIKHITLAVEQLKMYRHSEKGEFRPFRANLVILLSAKHMLGQHFI